MPHASADAVTAAGVERRPLDHETFRRAYDSFAPALQAYVRRTTGSEEFAEDIVQEVFLRVLRRSLPPLAEWEMKSYLFKTASSLLHDHWRKTARERRWRALASLGRPAVHRSASQTGFDGCFRLLKPRQRALLWLAYVEGYSHHEIAGVLGIAEKSVRVLLFRARRKMAGLLLKQGHRAEVKR